MLSTPAAGSIRTSRGFTQEQRCVRLGERQACKRTASRGYSEGFNLSTPVCSSVSLESTSSQRHFHRDGSDSDGMLARHGRAMSEPIPVAVSLGANSLPDDNRDVNNCDRCPSNGDSSINHQLQTFGVHELQEMEKGARVYAVSDLHTDHAENMAWVRQLVSRGEFHRDVLIVAGDVSDCMEVSDTMLHVWMERDHKHGWRTSVEECITHSHGNKL